MQNNKLMVAFKASHSCKAHIEQTAVSKFKLKGLLALDQSKSE